MKFIECNGNTSGSYYGFTFEKHSARDVNLGDVIWSNGKMIEISDFATSEDIEGLISMTSNYRAFKGALIRVGFDI